jgi:dTDP-4-dehydrorhamnose reductase
MKILLTGITGQVGGALHPRLSEFGAVIAPDRKSLDLARPGDLSGMLDNISPDLIVNPAAYTAVDLAEDERELAHRVNEAAPQALAKWAARRRVPIIHFSTDYVFDGGGDRPWHENDATEPLSVYGASKLAGELAIRNTDCNHLIIRTSWVFASKGRNFLNTIIRLAHERSELRVVADQIGAPTSARAIAEGVASILRGRRHRDELARSFASADGLVHMTTFGETSFHGFAIAIVGGLRRRGVQLSVGNVEAIDTSDYPTKAARPLNSRLDNSRLKEIFGVTMPNWKDALEVELDDLYPQRINKLVQEN